MCKRFTKILFTNGLSWRRLAVLLSCAALCLAAVGCGTAPAVSADGGAAGGGAGGAAQSGDTKPAAPLHLDELDVEFASDGRDIDGLLSLKADFPWALTDALEEQGVTVGSVNVTFGTSGEATISAMRSGAVQVAFLPAESYYAYRDGIVVAVEEGVTPDLGLGLAVTAVTDDADADARLAEALRTALPELAATLASYTGKAAKGRYSYDRERLDQLGQLYEQSVAAVRSEG